MGLSEQEQKVLEELERQLSGSREPRAKAAVAEETPTNYARLLVLGSTLVVIGLALMVFATSIHWIWFGVIAFVTMLVGLYLVSQNWSSKAIKATNKQKKSQGSFFQDRWDQRNRGQ